MSAFVYLLVHHEHEYFKIGKTRELARRVAELGLQLLDLSRSWAIEVGSEEEARRTERILHWIFRHTRLKPAEAERVLGIQDGASEWFRMSAFAEVLSFLEQNQTVLNGKLTKPAQLAALVASAPAALNEQLLAQSLQPLTEICRSLFGNGATARVMQWLYVHADRNRTYPPRLLSRLTGIPYGSAHKTLTELVTRKLVQAHPTPRGLDYSAPHQDARLKHLFLLLREES